MCQFSDALQRLKYFFNIFNFRTILCNHLFFKHLIMKTKTDLPKLKFWPILMTTLLSITATLGLILVAIIHFELDSYLAGLNQWGVIFFFIGVGLLLAASAVFTFTNSKRRQLKRLLLEEFSTGLFLCANTQELNNTFLLHGKYIGEQSTTLECTQKVLKNNPMTHWKSYGDYGEGYNIRGSGIIGLELELENNVVIKFKKIYKRHFEAFYKEKLIDYGLT